MLLEFDLIIIFLNKKANFGFKENKYKGWVIEIKKMDKIIKEMKKVEKKIKIQSIPKLVERALVPITNVLSYTDNKIEKTLFYNKNDLNVNIKYIWIHKIKDWYKK